MVSTTFVQFLVGMGISLLVGLLVRIIIGMRLNLFLISDDSRILDQTVIPITSENKKRLFWSTLLKGKWREDIEMTLTDYQNHSYVFRIGFGLLRRYHLAIQRCDTVAVLDGRNIREGRQYPMRTGMRLAIGDRAFTVLVSSAQHEVYREFQTSTGN